MKIIKDRIEKNVLEIYCEPNDVMQALSYFYKDKSFDSLCLYVKKDDTMIFNKRDESGIGIFCKCAIKMSKYGLSSHKDNIEIIKNNYNRLCRERKEFLGIKD